MAQRVIEFLNGLAPGLQHKALLDILGLVCIGLPVVYFLSRSVRKVGAKRLSPQVSMILQKAILYLGVVIILLEILQTLNVKLQPLLGAAGIVGIAIGFASQTSLSNVISGFFLISEKPFAIGDLIKVGEYTGTVAAIDLLSVKIRTLDNKMVRVPSENLIKTEVVNITRYPIRRLDIDVGVAYKEDPGRVDEVLRDIARKNPLILDEPEPVVLFKEFGDSALLFLFGVWFLTPEFLKARNSIMRDIKERFDAEGIEIPFPHRTIYTGQVTTPYPIRIASDEEVAPRGQSQESSSGGVEDGGRIPPD